MDGCRGAGLGHSIWFERPRWFPNTTNSSPFNKLSNTPLTLVLPSPLPVLLLQLCYLSHSNSTNSYQEIYNLRVIVSVVMYTSSTSLSAIPLRLLLLVSLSPFLRLLHFSSEAPILHVCCTAIERWCDSAASESALAAPRLVQYYKHFFDFLFYDYDDATIFKH